MRLRSILFAPGNDERKLRRALEEPADVVVADLEDAVPAGEKEHARAIVREVLADRGRGPQRFVRINSPTTELFEGDVEAVQDLALDGLVLPKADAGVRVPAGLPAIAIIETAAGIAAAREVASAAGVVALLLGAADLALELALVPRDDGRELAFFRSTIVLESALARLSPPIDGVHVDVRDLEGLRQHALLARSFGMGGKACVHPAQVEVVNACFAPTSEELAQAQRVVAAYDEATRSGAGVVAVGGRMVDLPVVERARQLLAAEGLSTAEGDERAGGRA